MIFQTIFVPVVNITLTNFSNQVVGNCFRRYNVFFKQLLALLFLDFSLVPQKEIYISSSKLQWGENIFYNKLLHRQLKSELLKTIKPLPHSLLPKEQIFSRSPHCKFVYVFLSEVWPCTSLGSHRPLLHYRHTLALHKLLS